MQVELGQLAALSAVVGEGTFDAAARRLDVTPSAISQRLRALEHGVGQVVVVRSKPVRVTAAGAVLLRLARQVESLCDEAVAEMSGAESLRRVAPMALAVNADSLSTWLLPSLAPLADTFSFDLHRADEEATANLLRDGTVTAAVTTDAVAVAGCSTEVLGRMRYRAVASPDFVRRWFPRGVDAGSLQQAPVIVFDRADDLHHGWLRTRGIDPGRLTVHRIPSASDIVAAARMGLGWAMVPVLQDSDLPAEAVVPLDRRSSVAVVLYWQQWRLRSPSLDALAAAVRTGARARLDPVRRAGGRVGDAGPQVRPGI